MTTPSNKFYNFRGPARKTTKEVKGTKPTSEPSQCLVSINSGESSSSREEGHNSDLDPSPEIHLEEEMSLNIQMHPFEGRPGQYAEDWLDMFDTYCKAQKVDDERKWCLFAFMLKGHAETWYRSLSPAVKNNSAALVEVFRNRFNGSDGLPPDTAIFTIKQYEGEPVSEYVSRITSATSRTKLLPETIAHLASEGLTYEIRKLVMPQSLRTLEDVRKAALVAERCVASEKCIKPTVASVTNNDFEKLTENVCQQVIAALSSKMDLAMNIKPRVPEETWSRRRFHQQQSAAPPFQHSRNARQQQGYRQQQYQQPQGQRQQQQVQECRYCGGEACSFSKCPARKVNCSYCNKKGHFTETCLRKKQDESNYSQ